MDVIRKYAKGIAAAVGSFCTAVSGVYADNIITMDEWGNLLVAGFFCVATIVTVIKVENKK